MDHEKLSYFKKRLQDELQLVESELKELGVRDTRAAGGWDVTVGEVDESATESDEVADRLEELEERQSELPEIEARKHDLEHALSKIESSTYGVCESGGEPIEEERLEANPAARTCEKHLA